MATPKKDKAALNPADCIVRLPEIPLQEVEQDQENSLRRVELRHSILAIADLTHVSETKIVQSVVKNVLGKLPELED